MMAEYLNILAEMEGGQLRSLQFTCELNEQDSLGVSEDEAALVCAPAYILLLLHQLIKIIGAQNLGLRDIKNTDRPLYTAAEGCWLALGAHLKHLARRDQRQADPLSRLIPRRTTTLSATQLVWKASRLSARRRCNADASSQL